MCIHSILSCNTNSIIPWTFQNAHLQIEFEIIAKKWFFLMFLILYLTIQSLSAKNKNIDLFVIHNRFSADCKCTWINILMLKFCLSSKFFLFLRNCVIKTISLLRKKHHFSVWTLVWERMYLCVFFRLSSAMHLFSSHNFRYFDLQHNNTVCDLDSKHFNFIKILSSLRCIDFHYFGWATRMNAPSISIM